MSTRIRWYRPDRLYEITTRTMQERFLLRPGRASRELVLGVIARAMTLYPAVQLYAFNFLSNHYHMLASATDGVSLMRFVNHVNSNVARELGRIHGWDGRFWQRRASTIEVVDDHALVDRLRYIISQGLKEGLVRHARDWSGASAIPALVGDGQLEGLWIDRDRETRAARRGRGGPLDEYRTWLPIQLTPIPPWAHLAPADLAARHRRLVTDVERDAARKRMAPPLGIRAVEALDPHARPLRSEQSRAPLCHASTKDARSSFRAAYRAFVDAFRRAATAIHATSHALFPGFPPGSCPRPPTYIPEPSSLVARQIERVPLLLRPPVSSVLWTPA